MRTCLINSNYSVITGLDFKVRLQAVASEQALPHFVASDDTFQFKILKYTLLHNKKQYFVRLSI